MPRCADPFLTAGPCDGCVPTCLLRCVHHTTIPAPADWPTAMQQGMDRSASRCRSAQVGAGGSQCAECHACPRCHAPACTPAWQGARGSMPQLLATACYSQGSCSSRAHHVPHPHHLQAGCSSGSGSRATLCSHHAMGLPVCLPLTHGLAWWGQPCSAVRAVNMRCIWTVQPATVSGLCAASFAHASRSRRCWPLAQPGPWGEQR